MPGKSYDLHVVRKSTVAEIALSQIGPPYDIERDAKNLSVVDRQQLRLARAVPIINALYYWLFAGSLRIGQRAATVRELLPHHCVAADKV